MTVLAGLRCARDLFWTENVLRKELRQHSMKVKFFILSIHEKSLAPMEGFVGRLNL